MTEDRQYASLEICLTQCPRNSISFVSVFTYSHYPQFYMSIGNEKPKKNQTSVFLECLLSHISAILLVISQQLHS